MYFHALLRSFFVVAVSVILSGCVTTPEFDKISGITPSSIVHVIECELIEARNRYPRLRYDPNDKRSEYWVAVADLTLQVDESATLTPSFTHTDVVSKTVSKVFNWGVKLDTQAQRIFNQSVAFSVSALRDSSFCHDVSARGFGLNGDLGLAEVIGMAFGSFESVRQGVKFNTGGKSSSAFGESVQFVVTKNVNNLGPTWILSFFKGPGGLLQMQRGDTHKVTISFAPGPAPSMVAGALDAAKSNNLILQNQSVPSNIINQLQQKLP